MLLVEKQANSLNFQHRKSRARCHNAQHNQNEATLPRERFSPETESGHWEHMPQAVEYGAWALLVGSALAELV